MRRSFRPGTARAGRRRVQAAVAWLLFAAVVTALLGVLDATAQAQNVPRGPERGEPPVDGRVLWQRDCASCHGAQGNGTRWGPDLQGKGAAAVHLAVTTGRMPLETLADLHDEPYRPDDRQVVRNVRGDVDYLPGQVAALVDYARQIIEGPDVPIVDVAGADVSHGFDLFQRNCASCHAWSTRGGALTNGHVATSLQRATPENVVSAMRTGLGTMPEFPATVISEQAAADIAAYVKYMAHPRNEGGHPMAYIGPVSEGFAAWFLGIFGVLVFVRWIGQRA